MNQINALLAFVLTALVIEITPGPNMTYLAALSLSSGMRTGFAAVVGIALGLATYGLIATFGITAIIDKSPLLYGLLRWGGVLYLLWLAWDTWSTGDTTSSHEFDERPWRALQRGLITNLLNPKAAIFYIAVLPEFIRSDNGSVVRQTLLLSIIYVLIATLIHATIVALAGSLQSTIVTANNRSIIRRCFAFVLVSIALWFALATGRSSAP